jgi:hypothetical protein
MRAIAPPAGSVGTGIPAIRNERHCIKGWDEFICVKFEEETNEQRWQKKIAAV